MKKLFATISAAAMLAVPMINAFPTNAANFTNYYRSVWTDYAGTDTSAHKEYLVGDANGSGTVTLTDATVILQHIANPDKYRLTGNKLKNADTNGDGSVTAMDALIIQKVIAGNTTFADEQVYFKALGDNYNSNPSSYRIYEYNNGFQAVLPGDVNNSGTITYADLVAFRQAEATGQGFHFFGDDYRRAGRAANVNNDGVVNEDDFYIIFDLID